MDTVAAVTKWRVSSTQSVAECVHELSPVAKHKLTEVPCENYLLPRYQKAKIHQFLRIINHILVQAGGIR